MTTTPEHPLVRDWLARFDGTAAEVAPDRRRRLREDLAAHLHEATDPGMPDGAIRDVLDELGTPAEILAEESAGAPSPEARPAVTRARVVGGALLMLSSVVGLLVTGVAGGAPSAAFVAGVLVLVLGPGSVTARRPLGTGALVGLVLLDAGRVFVVPLLVDPHGAGGLDGELIARIVIASMAGRIILGVIGTVQIARTGVVPHRWRWVPLIVLAVVTAVWIVGDGLNVASWAAAEALRSGIGDPFTLVTLCGSLLLGVLTIVWALRAAPTAGAREAA